MKQYAIIPVADPVRPDALVSLLKEHNVEMYDHYAPRVWFVKYNGTVQQLTDLHGRTISRPTSASSFWVSSFGSRSRGATDSHVRTCGNGWSRRSMTSSRESRRRRRPSDKGK